jgi:hypothetical protein
MLLSGDVDDVGDSNDNTQFPSNILSSHTRPT